MEEMISRKAAIDAFYKHPNIDWTTLDVLAKINALPSAQPERLTDDDFETIRIHLNAYKEKLCNQHRWEEANEYQRIIDRFMAFASAQPEIILCKDCRHWRQQTNYQGVPLSFGFCESDDMWRSLYGETYEVAHIDTDDDFYCGYAERRTDDTD